MRRCRFRQNCDFVRKVKCVDVTRFFGKKMRRCRFSQNCDLVQKVRVHTSVSSWRKWHISEISAKLHLHSLQLLVHAAILCSQLTLVCEARLEYCSQRRRHKARQILCHCDKKIIQWHILGAKWHIGYLPGNRKQHVRYTGLEVVNKDGDCVGWNYVKLGTMWNLVWCLVPSFAHTLTGGSFIHRDKMQAISSCLDW